MNVYITGTLRAATDFLKAAGAVLLASPYRIPIPFRPATAGLKSTTAMLEVGVSHSQDRPISEISLD